MGSLESGSVTDLIIHLGQVKYCSDIAQVMCFLPPFAQHHAVSIQCFSLSGQPDRFIILLNTYGHLHLCETCPGIPLSLLPLFCFLIHSLFQPCLLSLYYVPAEQNQYGPCPCKAYDPVHKTK